MAGKDVKPAGLTAPGATLTEVGTGFRFTEGPAADAKGAVFFTDIPNRRIHKWADGKVVTFREDSGGANGLMFDKAGNLLACEGKRRRVVSIDPSGKVTPLAETFGGKPFNQPNDLWIDPAGGVYFTDPNYGKATRQQDGDHVYYITPGGGAVLRIIDDMVRPNGIIGTPDGKVLFVSDRGDKKTWRYRIKAGGKLADKTLFVPFGSDGMTLDEPGNLYITTDAVLIFDPKGKQIGRIETPQSPSNVTFAGPHRKTLFITAGTSVYTLEMQVAGAQPAHR
jgi:gluconolactonase